MKTFQRILAVLLCLVMSLGMISMVASAESIITGTEGSITIHKYELNGQKGDNAPGTELDTTDLPTGATALPGVTFTAYQIVDANTLKGYYDGTADDTTEAKITATVADPTIRYTESNGVYTVTDINGKTVNGTEKVTDNNGIAAFTGLNLGLYLIIETDAPEKVVTAETPFLVSLPMTVNNEWLYDIHVYPKNSTSEGNVSLVKKDDSNNPLRGVTFKLEKQEGNTWTAVGENLTTNDSGTITWSSLTHGNYKITEISAPEQYIVDPNPIAFTVETDNTITCDDERALLTVDEFNTTSKTLTLTLVNEEPTIDKEITAGENTAGVGETVSYEVTVPVPVNIAAMETYKVTDVPTGLQVDMTTLAVDVKDGETVTDLPDTCYTATGNDDGGFTIEFNTTAMGDYAGNDLVITYDSTITTAAAVDNEAPNTATLEYTNKLGTDSTYEIDDNEVTKLYKATIIKRLDSTNGTLASGVKFNAYDNANCTTALKFTKEADGTYTLDPAGSVTELVTDANGQIVINGLGKHTYYLVETETYAGYNLLSGSVEMKVGDETDFEYEITIVNKQGFNLPATGGIGTLMFIIIGGVLMAGGICLIVPNKKRAI